MAVGGIRDHYCRIPDAVDQYAGKENNISRPVHSELAAGPCRKDPVCAWPHEETDPKTAPKGKLAGSCENTSKKIVVIGAEGQSHLGFDQPVDDTPRLHDQATQRAQREVNTARAEGPSARPTTSRMP